MKVLVLGGAGFIGTHLVAELLHRGHDVTVLDNFSPQVHEHSSLRNDIADATRLIVGDIADKPILAEALTGQDVVVHLAAETGTGQSMYQVARYERANGLGTANLFDCIVNDSKRTVHKVIVASSRAIYGEGKYSCAAHGAVYPQERAETNLDAKQFEPTCPICASPCSPLPSDEETPATPSSYYGLTKFMQERTVLLFAKALGISGIALRFQNVYGPGQSLRNPYTGILAVFSNRARAGRSIDVFEDGLESRDFIYVADAVRAICKSLDVSFDRTDAYNVGTGVATTIKEVAGRIVEHFRSTSSINITGLYRKGDIRHNFADTAKCERMLDFVASTPFAEGLRHFLLWAEHEAQPASDYERSIAELRLRGLLRG